MGRMIPGSYGKTLDPPEEFDALPPAKKSALLAWIDGAMIPAKTYGKHTSYTLKHCFGDDGFYVTNGEFKGAMLAAGYEPKDRKAQNWTFKVRPRARGLGVARTHSEALGYTLPENRRAA